MEKNTLPTMQFDRKTVLWVACHQDQNGEPLICVEFGGQIVPIATVETMSGMIKRAGASKSSYDAAGDDYENWAYA